MKKKALTALLLLLILSMALSLAACGKKGGNQEPSGKDLDENGYYYSAEDVSSYLISYGKLPSNFVTKDEARKAGWSEGNPEKYIKGAAIGNEPFGNREKLLPRKEGRSYYSCDIDTNGIDGRGEKRLVFSNDGLIYYTEDYFDSFEHLYGDPDNANENWTPNSSSQTQPSETPDQQDPPKEDSQGITVKENGTYFDKEHVALYIHTYGHLPDNYVTKEKAREAGWEGGSVQKYLPGKAIGGDKYSNYEKTLPAQKGRQYFECDIDTDGRSSRGAKRIVFSNDGLIYYTEDHYEHFTLLYGEE